MPARVPAGDLGSASAGLASAAAWGAGDFTGGLAARRASVWRVVAVVQAAGLALLVALLLVLREPLPPARDLAWAAGAGACGAVGLSALYAALNAGSMGVAAPVTGVVASVVPVLVGVWTEGSPGAWAFAGFGLALAGITLVSATGERATTRRALSLALLAGAGFGGFLVLIDRTSGETFLWPLVAVRVTSAALVGLVILARRPPRTRHAPPWGLMLLAALLDTGGNAFFLLAAQLGRLDVAAVLSSLYPAMTVLLARVVLRERMTRAQLAGLALVLVAIVLIAR